MHSDAFNAASPSFVFPAQAGAYSAMGTGLRRCDRIFGGSIGLPPTNESYEWSGH